MIKEGYKKSKPGLFKVPSFQRWMIFATSAELIQEINKAREADLSQRKPAREILGLDYTLRMLNSEDMYQNGIIRTKLTRNIAATFGEVQDELIEALSEFIPAGGDEWVKISILPALEQKVCRATNRIFVGKPLCRNRDYQKLAVNFTGNVIKSAYILSMFPKPLKPIAARIFSEYPSQVRQTMGFLGPMVKERFEKMGELGNTWEDAPDDMLMWLMSEAKGVERSLDGLARRLLFLNFASIQTISATVAQILYRLIVNPDYLEPLRQEIETALADEGWTKAGMDKLHKLDAFMRETQRIDSTHLVAVIRLAQRPFTFSNGVTVPAGTLLAAPACAIHMDEEIYPNPEQLDGCRFLKTHDINGDVATTGFSSVSTSPNHLTFGLGRHACPGRFFAVNEVRLLLAHIIITYDVKLEEGKRVPPTQLFGVWRVPQNADLLFRKRRV